MPIRLHSAVLLLLLVSGPIAAQQAPPAVSNYQMPPSGQVSVQAEGGLILETRLNGKGPFKTLFDTGSVNIMSADLARTLGLKIDTPSIEMGTSTPASVRTHTAQIDTLQIGDLVVRHQTFFVVDLPGGENAPSLAIGWELLQAFAVRIDFERQLLTFYDESSFHYSGPGTAVPIRLEGNLILVPATIAGASGWFELDTGNESGTMVNSRFTIKNGLLEKIGPRFLAYNGRGFAGPSPKAYLARLNSLRIGDVQIPSVIARFSDDRADQRDFDGNFGQDVLTRFSEVFDLAHDRVYFEPTPASTRPEIFNRAGLIFDDFGHGLEVMTVLPKSPGEQAGIREGDIITAIDGHAPDDAMNQPAFLRPAGTRVQLTTQRGANTREVTLTLRDVL